MCLVAANVKILASEGVGIGAVTTLGKAPSNPVPPPADSRAPEFRLTTGLKRGKFWQGGRRNRVCGNLRG